MAQAPGCFREIAAGIELRVRLTPRASLDRIDGLAATADGAAHLAARVRAVPEKGKANQALEKLIADWLGVSPSQVNVVGGATSRLKTVSVEGDPRQLAEHTEAKLAAL